MDPNGDGEPPEKRARISVESQSEGTTLSNRDRLDDFADMELIGEPETAGPSQGRGDEKTDSAIATPTRRPDELEQRRGPMGDDDLSNESDFAEADGDDGNTNSDATSSIWSEDDLNQQQFLARREDNG